MNARIALAVTALASLVGCVATPKPELAEEGYKIFAAWFVGGDRCVLKGSIQPELVAFGKMGLNQQLSTFSYSPERLNTAISRTDAETPSSEPTQEACNAMALRIAELKQQQEANAANFAMQQQSINQSLEVLRSNTPTMTSCNRYGTQVICNTY
ncbi:hypothetical protein PMA3_20640 [Pseudomonas silesiensis]|uniref:Lipoprotein n=1 Tax=Pseudomonas silesiensis TaxID=1853130 RepID=A0A191YX25_9PSED|nr:hypothetical protein [Pseudomonas silesiensis]ANJ57435.1 hypothetical protein PMA3_20640 [Pseudomonas silesiensis]